MLVPIFRLRQAEQVARQPQPLEIHSTTAGRLLRTAGLPGQVEAVLPLAGGQNSAVYELVSHGTPTVVLKVYSENFHWKMEKEVFAYKLIAERTSAVPTPEVLAVDDSKTLIPQNYVLLTKLEGQLASTLTDELPGAALRRLYRQLGGILRELHHITFPEFGYISTHVVDPHASNAAYMQFQLAKKLHEFRELGCDEATAAQAERYVSLHGGLLADCETAVLCHNDFHESNILVSQVNTAWEVTGIIDVENVLAGDPLLDIAKTDYYAIRGNPDKLAGLLEGYGPLREDWQETLRLYKLYHAIELWDWFRSNGEGQHLASIATDIADLSRSS